MNKTQILNPNDKIVSKKYGRWTFRGMSIDGYMLLEKIRKGKVTETFKCLPERLFS